MAELRPAEEMKESGIEWAGMIPQNWQIIKNKYLLKKMYSGGTPKATDDLFYVEDGIPFVSISDMSATNYVYETKKHLSEAGLKEKNLKVLDEGTILYSIYATIGAVSELRIKAAISQAMLALLLRDGYQKEYYKYNLRAMRESIFSLSNGNTQFNLNAEKVWNLFFLKPSLSEQQAIADYLDYHCSEIDEIIEEATASIEEYKKLKQAVIIEAVTQGLDKTVMMKESGVDYIGKIPIKWSVTKLGRYIDVLPGYAFSSSDFSNDGIPLLRGVNVTPSGVRWDDTVFWNKPIEGLEKYLLEAGDIVVGLDRPWIKEGARTFIVQEEDLPCLLLQRVCRIRCSEKVLNSFVYYWLSSKSFERALTCETTGVSVPHISTNQISGFIMAFPSIPEQYEIIDYLDRKNKDIDLLISEKQSLINDLQAYKKALIYEVVTGKRRAV